MRMNLRFPESELEQIAKRRVPSHRETGLIKLKPDVQQRGYLDKKLLKRVAYWKSPRRAELIDCNDEEYVKEITSWAFTATNERSRIEVLTLLDGVGWPTASAILHLFHEEPYPILDYRALWAIGLEVPNQYSFSFWWPYVEFCRDIARRNQVDMRTLDRALWQYSKEA